MSIPQEQFRISIDSFDGPLDLLLYLVKRAEVDICDIPIAQIADDYLEVLRSNSSIDVEMAFFTDSIVIFTELSLISFRADSFI